MVSKQVMGVQLAQGVLTLSAPIWPRLEEFVLDNNLGLLAEIKIWLLTKSPTICWLQGVRSSGKTHLAQALLSEKTALGEQGAFVSAKEAKKLSPDMLQGLELLPFLCIDNVDMLLSDTAWLLAIEHLSILMRDRGGCLLLIQKSSVIPISLQGLVLNLQPLTDASLKREALISRAKQSDIVLSDVVIVWLLKQFGDDLGQLMHVLTYLNHASMTLKRPITVPFAKKVLLQ
jgi:DnaA family protein